ncbi:hypothetical protein [Allomesorhizobium camelthorni]|uniref:Uncharacterized protein n=1 Tax=Allomesorhizobium camelthorni TaxID=475069 RepID=A0A6G4WJU2_9HYPH|nr:hypothetical protein [Mesorhizobium camelthorni]NGO55072.1 hypothetical protein [Mesorhizobium camelthorni]
MARLHVIDKTGPFTPVIDRRTRQTGKEQARASKISDLLPPFRREVGCLEKEQQCSEGAPTFDLVKSFRRGQCLADLLAQFGSDAGYRRYVIRLGCAPSGGVDTAAISSRKKKSHGAAD